MKQKIPCAAAASVIVLLSTLALVQKVHSLEPTSPPVRKAFSYLAVPGFALGAIVSLVVSRSVHNTSFWLALFVSVPVNWLLYYFALLGIFKLWLYLPRGK